MLEQADQIHFPPLRLDLRDGRLWNENTPVKLRPKSWELVRYMVTRPGELLSKQELIDAVWPSTIVTEASLNQAIRELRKALGDDARSPRFIETVHRRGFRFIAQQAEVPVERSTTMPRYSRSSLKLFGRQRNIEQLHSYLHSSISGNREIVFLTGEAGIGKTSLVRSFLDSIESVDDFSIGWGNCYDQHGECEAYLPILESVDQLARSQHGDLVRSCLKQYAPTWFAQFPWMLEAGHGVEQQLSASTPARMLREFCVFLEAL